MADKEAFSWKKFLSGLVSPLNFAKSFVAMVQIALILIVIMCVVFTGFWLKGKLNKPKTITAPVSITGMSGGTVHNSNDTDTKKFGIITF